jgi:hypothetical protein
MQWGNTDDAANSVIWAASNLDKPANTANQTALFGNTTADAFITGATVGQFGVSTAEAQAARAAGEQPAAGWVLQTTGSGGRAGRVTREILVAMSSTGITGDAEDAVFPDFTLSIVSQPQDASAESTTDEQATFTVAAASVPTGATITYLWEYTSEAGNTATFETANVAGFADETTVTLTADANTIADGTLIRVVVSASGADSVTSDIATLTVTTA